MPRRIPTRLLVVSYLRDHEGLERLEYKQAAGSEEESLPPAVSLTVHWQTIRSLIDGVHARLGDVMDLARLRRARDGTGIDGPAADLAAHVLPKACFAGVLEPPLHPHFDITHNLPAEIPW
ncbi:MAG: hypothetical protein HY721_09565, partial [Planctomycetes bacterium]|nr:hypothetical protein [Planctomycetota bacterium]